MKMLQKIVLAFYFFLPFQFALSPMSGIDLPIVRVFSILIFFLFLIISLYQRNFIVPTGWVSVFLFLFCTYISLSFFYSAVPTWSIRKILFIYSFLPLFIVTFALLKMQKNTAVDVVKAVVYGAFSIAFVGIIQFFAQFLFSLNTVMFAWSQTTPFFLGGTFSDSVITYNSWLVGIGPYTIMRAIAFFPDPHIFSFYLGLTAPLSLGLFLYTKKTRWITIFLTLIIANLLTFSRGGYVGISISGVLVCTILWVHFSVHLKRFLIAALLSLTFLFSFPQNPITYRFLSSFDTTDTSNTHRIELWSEALEAIQEKPFIGTGLGAYAHHVDPRADYRTPIYAHNIYLDVAVETGLIGLFLFLAIFSSSIVAFYRSRSNILTIFAIISILTFLAHSIFDTPIFSVHIFPLLLLIFSLAAHYETADHISKK